jgi:hypothetical protein
MQGKEFSVAGNAEKCGKYCMVAEVDPENQK